MYRRDRHSELIDIGNNELFERLTKEAFLIKYVLARAGAKDSHMDGTNAAAEAQSAWNYIQRAKNQ